MVLLFNFYLFFCSYGTNFISIACPSPAEHQALNRQLKLLTAVMQIRTSSSNSSVAPRYSTRRRMSVSGICVFRFFSRPGSIGCYRQRKVIGCHDRSRPAVHHTTSTGPPVYLVVSRGWFENVKKAPKKHNIGRGRTKPNVVGQISKRAPCRRRPSSSSRLTSKKRSNVPRGRERKGHCMPAQIIYSVSATGWRIK